MKWTRSHNKAISATESNDRSLLAETKRLVDLAFFSGIPMAVLFVIVGYLSHSVTILTSAAAFVLGLIVRYFAYESMKRIMKSDTVRFPYGTGKLENFSSLLYGALVVPSSIVLIILSVNRLIHPAHAINFSVAQIPVVISLARNAYLTYLSHKIRKRTASKLIQSYYINYRISAFYDSGVLLSLTVAGILMSSGNNMLPSYLDASVSLLVSVYALIMGIRLTTDNFKILIDLPLCEEDQLRILSVLAAHYNRFESVGNIYTRQSGTDRFIEIELYLGGRVSMVEIDLLRADMRQMLETRLGPVKFNIIPLLPDEAVQKQDPADPITLRSNTP